MATKLNEQQQKAVDSNSKNIVMIASAGSGKSTVLLSRIQRLISDGVPSSSILAMTFTNAAAQEMADRFQRANGNGASPKFCTFHAFCYYLMATDADIRMALGYIDVPDIATEDDYKRFRIIVMQKCRITLSSKKLNNSRKTLTAKEQFQYDIFWKEMEKELAKAHLITFDILCNSVCSLFVKNSPLVAKYKAQYQYILIDEFQDTSPIQWDFAKSFIHSNIFVCGDPQQMLYRFRGCTNDIIKELAESPDWELIKLPHNYRSTKQIVDYSNKIFEKVWKGSPYYLRGESDVDGNPVYIHDDFPIGDIDVVTPIIIDMHTASKSGKSVAILCRTNAEVDVVKATIESMGYPIQGKANNFAELTGILRSSLSSDYCVNWLSGQLPNEEYARYIRLTAISDTPMDELQFLNIFGGKFKKILDKIFDCRRILSQNSEIPIRFQEIIKYLNLPQCDKIFDVTNLSEGIDALIKSVNQIADEGIYVGTIHSVKGLEYDIVHVIGVDSYSFQTHKNEDERACFYVACTRAKSDLHLWFDDEMNVTD